MTDQTSPVDSLSYQMNYMRLKEPATPPYSMMLKNQAQGTQSQHPLPQQHHYRSNSYSFDPVIEKSLRPRAYSSSVFDFDYTPKNIHKPLTIRPPVTPNRRFSPSGQGQLTPPELSPYSDKLQFSPHTPKASNHRHPQHTSQASTGPAARAPVTPTQTASSKHQSPPTPTTPSAGNHSLGTPQQIYALCKDQKGCRSLQHKLQEGNKEVIALIFEATAPHIVGLMMDPFGNYFCQKLIEKCTPEQITEILQTIRPKVVEIALNQHGTRALQKIIEYISSQEQVDLLIASLDGSVVRIVRDINGNHVVQKCLVCLEQSGVQFIYDSIYCNVISVGTHRHGCCVLQRCLDSASPANKRMLVSQIVAKSLDLVRDPFGNYVCQYVLDLKIPDYTFGIIAQILGHLSELSTQKFSSNVVEKCLWTSQSSQKKAMVQELIEPTTMQRLLLDPYGNYVIQTVLESSKGSFRDEIATAVQTTLNNTRTPYGRRISSKLKTEK